MPGLSYDLKFDKTKGENDKIFIDNEITIAVEKKSFLYLAGTVLEFSGGINGKDLFLIIQMQLEHVVVENHSHFSTKLKS
jgi:Fe-S cluster assembly iron-binding protein IscA